MYQRKNGYDPVSKQAYALSRSRLERFFECPRCFYLDRRLGVDRPSWPAFTLNSAVDTQLKKEFDVHRTNGTTHPLMKAYGIKAIPFKHAKMDEWRYNFKGVRVLHQPTNLIIKVSRSSNFNRECPVMKRKIFVIFLILCCYQGGFCKLFF